jgi:RNA polymerase I-specific transcription initiation factor RRN3
METLKVRPNVNFEFLNLSSRAGYPRLNPLAAEQHVRTPQGCRRIWKFFNFKRAHDIEYENLQRQIQHSTLLQGRLPERQIHDTTSVFFRLRYFAVAFMVPLVPAMRASTSGASAKPSKPLLRRSTLSGTIRKIGDTDLEADLTSAPPSPRKKARVSFNPNVEEKIMDPYRAQGKSLDVVRIEVRRAIADHLRGNSENYSMIKEIFSAERREDEDEDEEFEAERRANIKTYLVALTNYTSELNRNCSDLVKSVVSCEWVGRDEAFVKAYVHFLGSLASAQGSYVSMVLGRLVGNFCGGKTFLTLVSQHCLIPDLVRLSSGRLAGYPDVHRDQLSSRIHVALKYLLQLIPSASGTLSPILANQFPSPEDSKKEHVAYIQNLIRVMDYAPELKSDIFALITDRLVKIDVQMQVDLDDLDDEVAATIVEAITLHSNESEDAEGDDSDSDADSVASDEDIYSDARRMKEVQVNVEKMDSILNLLFKLYSTYFEDPNSVEAVSMFETLLTHFANIILPAYRSRHTQFLLFHFAQTAEHLVDQFAGTCVQLAFESSRPAVLRQSAAAYLASFVARGAHVEPHVIRTVFELIGNNLEHIRVENELTCRGPDLKRYSTFYAMTQALLYIFCFRWRDLITSPEDLDDEDITTFLSQDLAWAPGIKDTLHSMIYSKLNPLKVCSPPIVSEFAKIAHHLRFMYVYPLLETNKRLRLSQFSNGGNGALRDAGHGGNNESWHQLDAYFPFDPYQLPLSKKWVEDDYVQWKGIPGLNQEEEEDDSGEEEDEDVDFEEDTATDDDNE